MPSATYTIVVGAVGADDIALIQTGPVPGALFELETILISSPSVTNGPRFYIQPTTLGIMRVGGRTVRPRRRR